MKEKRIVNGKVVGHPVNPGINQLGQRIESDGKSPENVVKIKIQKKPKQTLAEEIDKDLDKAG